MPVHLLPGKKLLSSAVLPEKPGSRNLRWKLADANDTFQDPASPQRPQEQAVGWCLNLAQRLSATYSGTHLLRFSPAGHEPLVGQEALRAC